MSTQKAGAAARARGAMVTVCLLRPKGIARGRSRVRRGAPGSSIWGIGFSDPALRRRLLRDGAELLHHPQRVEHAPVLGHASVAESHHVEAVDLEVLAGGR